MIIFFKLLNEQHYVTALSIQRKYTCKPMKNEFDERRRMLDVLQKIARLLLLIIPYLQA
jgi:hypothetical protein